MKSESKINTVGREGSRTHVMEAKFCKTWKTLHGHVATQTILAIFMAVKELVVLQSGLLMSH